MGIREFLKLPKKSFRKKPMYRLETSSSPHIRAPSPGPSVSAPTPNGESSDPPGSPVKSSTKYAHGNQSNPELPSPPATEPSPYVMEDSTGTTHSLDSAVQHLRSVLNDREYSTNKQPIEASILDIKALAKSSHSHALEDEKERSRRENLYRRLEDILRDPEPPIAQGSVEGASSSVRSTEKLVEATRDALMEYQISLRQDLYEKSCGLIERADLALLDCMHHVNNAGYIHGEGRCMKGTGRNTFLQLENWLCDKQDGRVFWLRGKAGTGKSTITRTFVEMAFADGRLGASFFCSQYFHDRRSLRSILPTLAFQLARRYPPFRERLLRVLMASPDVEQESLCSQMEKLIVNPFKATNTNTPILIVIEALDECQDKEPISALLSVFFRYIHDIPLVKFLITGESEPLSDLEVRSGSLRPLDDVLMQHEVKPSSVDDDIKLFLRTELAKISKDRGDQGSFEDWPSSNDIDVICTAAAGQFIYATTVVRCITLDNRSPAQRLAGIISDIQDHSARDGTNIHFLYTHILEQVSERLHGVPVADDEELLSQLKAAVGAVLFAFNPLSEEALSGLLRVPNLPAVLDPIRPLLLPYGEDNRGYVFHQTFYDFLAHSRQWTNGRFLADPSVHHREILFLCLDLMKRMLKRNICALEDYAVLSEIRDLPDHRRAHIGDPLRYACQFWAKHLAKAPTSGPGVKEVERAIDVFFEMHFLFWIEVLSLSGTLEAGVRAVDDIRQWYLSTGIPCKWADDGQRFLLEHFDVIHDSPSHIYHSALPLSPSSSWIRKCYGAELSREVKVTAGLPTEWGMCSRTVSFAYTPLVLASWGGRIAVGLECDGILVLDVVTGVRVDVFSGHTSGVRSLAFSADGTRLVSGSDDKSVKLWDVQTGGVIRTFYGHSSSVTAVSVSPDLATIISGSWDGAVLRWNTSTGESLPIKPRHKCKVTAVSFSPTDPQTIISTSEGNDVKRLGLDDGQDASLCRGIDVAYSPDGTSFVSSDATVRNSQTGVEIAKLPTPKMISTFHLCRFSGDGRFVACATKNEVFVWDVSGPTPHLIGNFVGHTKEVTSLTFPSVLVSASRDRSVRFWQVNPHPAGQDVIDTHSASPAPSPIKFVSLEVKSEIAISCDSNGLVKIWNISTGQCTNSVQTRAEGRVDMRMLDSGLVVVWYNSKIGGSREICVQSTREGSVRTLGKCWSRALDLRIAEDGSRVFLLEDEVVQAWPLAKGEVVKIGFTYKQPDRLVLDGSKVWVLGPNPTGWGSPGLRPLGWYFGDPGSSPVPLDGTSFGVPCSDSPRGVGRFRMVHFWVEDTVTRRRVFHLPKQFKDLLTKSNTRWDGGFLVIGLPSGEMVILDFNGLFTK